jgi:hypothetical protein
MTDQIQDVQPTEQQVQEPVILTFQMSLENVNNLIGILGNQSFNEVAQLISIIRSQAVQQLQAAAAPKETPEA